MLATAVHDPLERLLSTWDAVVVGAGPAGATAARGLARAGASVLLLDRRPFPRWKVCGACLGPGAFAVLRAADLEELPSRLGAQPLREMVLSGWRRTARIPLRGSASLSREALDAGLVSEARRAGAVFRAGARATLDAPADGRTSVRVVEAGHERTVTARVVIDATGLGGALDRAVRASRSGRPAVPRPWPRPSRVGVGAVFERGAASVPPGELRMVVGRCGYVGLVRLEDGRLDVAAAVDQAALRGRSPAAAVASILREGGHGPLSDEPMHGWRGTPALTREGPVGGSPTVYRAGDVAGYVEPFTGEGIGWALADGADVAAFALRALNGSDACDGAAWQRVRRRRAAASQRLCRQMAWALRRTWLVRPALHVLSGAPSLARPLVRRAAHAPARSVGSRA